MLQALQVYDDAFRDLTVNSNPIAFRDFLLKAPEMFLTLGEKIGVISHIASFWRYRFPAGKPPVADLMEAVDILQEFEAGLGCEPVRRKGARQSRSLPKPGNPFGDLPPEPRTASCSTPTTS